MDPHERELAQEMEGVEENGDSFEQQIDDHIQSLERPFISDTLIRGPPTENMQGQGSGQGGVSRGLGQGDGRAQQRSSAVVQQEVNVRAQGYGQAVGAARPGSIQQVIQTVPAPPFRSKITINGREPSPNRFYSSQSEGTVVASRTVTPPKLSTLGYSFGPRPLPQPNQQLMYNQATPINPLHNPTIIRSRVISEVQRPPVPYLPQGPKPQSSTVIGSGQNMRQGIQMQVGQNVYRPPTGSRVVYEKPGSVVSQIRNTSPPTGQLPRITINNHTPTHLHFLHQYQHQKPSQQPQPQLLQQQHITTIHSQHRHIQIHEVTIHLRTVHEMIQVMLAGEKERDKLEFINRLSGEYRGLEGKLEVMIGEMDRLRVENGELRAALQAGTGGNTEKPHIQQIPQTTRTQDQQDQLDQLHQKLHELQTENESLLKKNMALQEQEFVEEHLSHDELLQTIESQKAIIRRLEQELIASSSKPVSQGTGEEAGEGGESKFMAIIDSKEAYINELEAEIIRHKTNIKSLKQQVLKQRTQRNQALTASEQLERQSRQQTLQQQKSQISNQNSTTTTAVINKQIQKLEEVIRQKDEELDKLKEKIFQVQDEFDQMVDERDRRIKDLHQQIMMLSEKKAAGGQDQELESQLKRIKAEISSKDEELAKLKTSVQQTSQLQIKIQQLQTEKNSLNESLRLKTTSEQQLKQTLTSLQTRLKSQNKDEQMKAVIEALKKKQNEIIKLRQTMQLHVTTIEELENQINTLKDGFKGFEAQLNQERRLSSQKYVEYENKIREIESRGNSQHKSEESEIQKLQHTITQLKQKLKSYQQGHHHHHHGNQHMQQMQASSATTNQQQPHHDFRLQYSESQVKIFQLENTIKDRENRIRQLQSNLETMKLKANHNTLTEQDMITNQEIELLRKKIQELEAKGGRKTDFGYFNRDYQTNALFQQRVIYELKQENEKLKAMLSRQDWTDAHSYTGLKAQTQRTRKLDKHEQSYLSTIQFRLSQFNKKLSQLINQPYGGSSSLQPLKTAPNYEILQLFQKQKNFLLLTHHKEIESLQARIVDLQRYCASLEFREGIASFDYSYGVTMKERDQGKAVVNQQMGYYREKNKELENRVDVLIGLNKELKDKLAIYMKPQGEQNLQFYKFQITKLQKRIADLQTSLKSLTQQKSSLASQLQKAHSDKSSQSLIDSLQQSLQEQTSKSSKLQSQNNILEQELKKYTQQVIDLSSEILGLKGQVHQGEGKIGGLEASVRKMGTRVGDLEDQLTKARNQVEILKAEIQRLNEELTRKRGDSDRELSSLKSKIAELQQELKQANTQLLSVCEQNTQKDQIIDSLNGRLSASDRNYASQTSKIASLNQRIRELENQLDQNQMAMAKLTNERNQLSLGLEQKNAEIGSLNRRLNQIKEDRDSSSAQRSQWQTRISQLEDTVRKLQQQLQLRKYSISTLQSQNQTLSQKCSSLSQTINELQLRLAQLQSRQQQREGIEYEIQLIRSVFIEIEVLAGEIAVQDDARQRGILGRVRQEVGRGLAGVQGVLGAL